MKPLTIVFVLMCLWAVSYADDQREENPLIILLNGDAPLSRQQAEILETIEKSFSAGENTVDMIRAAITDDQVRNKDLITAAIRQLSPELRQKVNIGLMLYQPPLSRELQFMFAHDLSEITGRCTDKALWNKVTAGEGGDVELQALLAQSFIEIQREAVEALAIELAKRFNDVSAWERRNRITLLSRLKTPRCIALLHDVLEKSWEEDPGGEALSIMHVLTANRYEPTWGTLIEISTKADSAFPNVRMAAIEGLAALSGEKRAPIVLGIASEFRRQLQADPNIELKEMLVQLDLVIEKLQKAK